MIYLERKSFEKTLADLDRCLELDPRYANANLNRAIVLFNQNHLDRALKDAQRSTEIQPRIWNTWYILGLVLIKLERNAEAREALTLSLQLAPEPKKETVRRILEGLK